MARPKGSKQTRPTSKAIVGYYELLKNAAEQGATLAAAELIKIHHMTNQGRNARQEIAR